MEWLLVLLIARHDYGDKPWVESSYRYPDRGACESALHNLRLAPESPLAALCAPAPAPAPAPPRASSADFDGDGAVTPNDWTEFEAAWRAANP